jgi:hypothetical protein
MFLCFISWPFLASYWLYLTARLAIEIINWDVSAIGGMGWFYLEVTLPTVLKTRKRWVEGGLETALGELPRPGQKPKLDAAQAARITALACSQAPEGHDHWTLRLLGAKIVELGFADSYSHEGVRQLLKKTNSSRGRSTSGASRKSTRSSLPAWNR